MPSLTFINTSGGPALTPREVRRMRGHITRTNFANRRKKNKDQQEPVVRALTTQCSPEATCSGHSVSRVSTPLSSAARLGLDHYSTAPSFARVWSELFLDGREYPKNADEADWINFLVSEPALVEATMAVGMRHFSPDASSQLRAAKHFSTATNAIIQRIEVGQAAHVPAVLGAVSTLAFGALLAQDSAGWNLHMEGLVRIVEEICARGSQWLPRYFKWLIVLFVPSFLPNPSKSITLTIPVHVSDSLNNIFSFPRFYHPKVAAVLERSGDATFSSLLSLNAEIIKWKNSVDSLLARSSSPSTLTDINDLQEAQTRILSQITTLQVPGQELAVMTTANAMEILIHLLWGSTPGVDLTLLAEKMKESLEALQVRGCSYMDMTSCQLMIGAVASRRGSATREWYVGKLKNAVNALSLRGWDNAVGILEQGLTPGAVLGESFQALWQGLRQKS